MDAMNEVVQTVAQSTQVGPMSFVESLGVAAMGLITVFAGLIILIVFIKLLSAFTSRMDSKKKNNGPVEKKEEPAPAMPAVPAPVVEEGIPADVIAAITAALAVVMGEGRFVVRHVKRVHNAPAWNRAGREEQIYSRF